MPGSRLRVRISSPASSASSVSPFPVSSLKKRLKKLEPGSEIRASFIVVSPLMGWRLKPYSSVLFPSGKPDVALKSPFPSTLPLTVMADEPSLTEMSDWKWPSRLM